MMHNRFVPALLVFLAALLTCETLLAACLVYPEPEVRGTRIRIQKESDQPLSEKKRFPDCSQLALVHGMIHVLYEQNGEQKHKFCNDPKKPCSVEASKLPSWLDTFKPQSRAGGKRMDKEVSRLPGIPHGKVFSMERAATFNLGKAGFTSWNLALTETGEKKPVYSRSGSDPVVQVPSNLLRPGGKYMLLIEGSNQKYKGGFDILGSTEAKDVARQIEQATHDTGVTAHGRKLDELIVLYENNLDYEVELLREELKL